MLLNIRVCLLVSLIALCHTKSSGILREKRFWFNFGKEQVKNQDRQIEENQIPLKFIQHFISKYITQQTPRNQNESENEQEKLNFLYNKWAQKEMEKMKMKHF